MGMRVIQRRILLKYGLRCIGQVRRQTDSGPKYPVENFGLRGLMGNTPWQGWRTFRGEIGAIVVQYVIH